MSIPLAIVTCKVFWGKEGFVCLVWFGFAMIENILEGEGGSYIRIR